MSRLRCHGCPCITWVAIFLIAGLGITKLVEAKDKPVDNLLANGDFEIFQVNKDNMEIPVDWTLFSPRAVFAGCSPKNGTDDDRALRIRFAGKPGAFQTILQTVPVEEKKRYDLEIFVRNNKDDPIRAGGTAQLVIEWRDEADQETKRSWTKKWDRSLSRRSWRCYKIRNVKTPKGTVNAVIGIHTSDGLNGSNGSYFADDILFTEH